MFEPKINYVLLENAGDVFFPLEIISMERSKARIIDNDIMHPVSEMGKYLIEMARNEGKMIAINKEAILHEKIDLNDIIVDHTYTLTELDARKRLINRRLFTKLAQNMNADTFGALYEFNILNSKFASLGFFITEENRQEIYIKIIEKDDSSLLDDLENFLRSKKIVDQMYDYYKKYKKAKEDLQYASTVDEVNEIYDRFITT